MGRNKVSEPPKGSEWFTQKLVEINTLRLKELSEREWTGNASLLMDRKNLRRLMELAAAAGKTGSEVFHVVYDPLPVVVNTRGEVTLMDDLPSEIKMSRLGNIRMLLESLEKRQGEIEKVAQNLTAPTENGMVHRIIAEKIPVNRLRICPVCDSIYWLKTKRGKTCGEPKCVDDEYEKTTRKPRTPKRGKR